MNKPHTRESIRDTLRASSDWNYTTSDSKLWRVAFQLYNEAHPADQLEIKWNCSKCFGIVKDWLEKA